MAHGHFAPLLIFIIVLCLDYSLGQHSDMEERVIQTLGDNVDAENFTYYRLQRDGYLRLELTSLKGDVDIYISSKSQYPSYSDYELKSDTCGVDTVTVSDDMSRPVYIAIFGHPNYLHSQFKLTIFSSPPPITESYEDLVAKYERYYFDDVDKTKEKEGRRSKPESRRSNTVVEEEQPLWIKILLGIIEFGIDVII